MLVHAAMSSTQTVSWLAAAENISRRLLCRPHRDAEAYLFSIRPIRSTEYSYNISDQELSYALSCNIVWLVVNWLSRNGRVCVVAEAKGEPVFCTAGQLGPQISYVTLSWRSSATWSTVSIAAKSSSISDDRRKLGNKCPLSPVHEILQLITVYKRLHTTYVDASTGGFP